MKILTAADARMHHTMIQSTALNQRLGYKVRGFDLEADLIPDPWRDWREWDRIYAPNDGKPPREMPERKQGKLPFKPYLISLDLTEPTVWMDADCFAIRPFGGVWKDNDFDIAVTMRRPEDRGKSQFPMIYGFLNAGVVFINNTPAAMKFLDLWHNQVLLTNSHSDQEALNILTLQCTQLMPEDMGKVFQHPSGARLKVLPCTEYNWIFFPLEPLPTTKIVHFKTDIRKAGMEWWNNRK